MRSGHRAPAPQAADPASLERNAREAKADPAMRDAVGAGVGVARNKIDGQADVGEAAGRFAAERAGIVRHAGDVAALEVLKARERLSASFAQAGYAGAPVLAVGDPAASAALVGSVGGRGAFLQYRVSGRGSYFLPLTPDARLTAGHKDFPDVAARADRRVAELARGGTLTREAALAAWTDELGRAWSLKPDAAALLARRLHGAR